MPIYEYTCKECKHEFEELVLSEDHTVVCPKCGSSSTEKLMSACSAKLDGGSQGFESLPNSGGGCSSGG